MKRSQLIGGFLFGLAVLAVPLMITAKPIEKSAAKVKASATASKPTTDGKQTVTITLNIEKGWYIYANPVGWETLFEARTDVQFQASSKVSARVQYPAGTLKADKIGKETVEYRVYQGQAVLQAQVQRQAGDTSPLRISVKVNSCKEPNKDGSGGVCLPQGTVIITVP